VNAAPMVEVDPQIFAAYFNRNRPHPAFARRAPSFRAASPAATRARPARAIVEYNAGALPVGVRPEETPRTGLFRRGDHPAHPGVRLRGWCSARRAGIPNTGALAHRCLDGIAAHARGLHAPMQRREGFIFLSSPGAVTPFHIDPEYNFLSRCAQQDGQHVGPADRFVLPEEELERFYATFVGTATCPGATSSRPPPSCSARPRRKGCTSRHVPHWVKNGPEVSVSFSITFRTADSERRELLYKANAHLRKLGFAHARRTVHPARPPPAARFGAAASLKRLWLLWSRGALVAHISTPCRGSSA